MPVINAIGNGSGGGSGPGPCGWELNPGLCCEDWDTFAEDVQTRATLMATRLMWAATGRRYGPCEWVVQPCNPGKMSPLYRTYPEPFGRGSSGAGWDYYPYLQNGEWFNPGTGGCGCCTTGCEVPLQGPTRTAAILGVTVAGGVVPASAYVVFDAHLLARIDGECWPTCVNYSNQGPPDFEVTYQRGLPVPQAVLDAASALACEFGKACVGKPCRLPQRLRRLSRQGVEVEVADIDRASARFLTGIEDIDMVIQAENPFALVARPRVYSPDRRVPRRVT